MVGNSSTSDSIILNATGLYTEDEARRLMKLADTYPTGNYSWNWTKVATGANVILGNNTNNEA